MTCCCNEQDEQIIVKFCDNMPGMLSTIVNGLHQFKQLYWLALKLQSRVRGCNVSPKIFFLKLSIHLS